MSDRVRWLLRADPPKDQPKRVQMEALRRSYPKAGWGHFLDTGLGKTCVVLNEFMMFVEDAKFDRLVIWAPNNFKPDWSEIAKEFRFPYPIYTFQSERRGDFSRWMDGQTGPCGVAINYEASIYPKSMDLIKRFVKGHKSYVAYDESIWLKNPTGEYFRALEATKTMYDVSRTLSGKPMTQGPHDLWSQLRMLGAADGWNFWAFRNRYCLRGGFKGKEVIGFKNEKEINDYLKSWSFLASKRDWSDLRDKSYTIRNYELTDAQQNAYDRMEEDFLIDLGEGRVATAEMVITRLNKLQQITCGFLIDDEGEAHDIIPIGKNPKLMALRSFMTNEVNGKLIVGAWHRHSIKLLQEALSKWKPVIIKGQMSPEEIKHNKALFNSPSDHDVIICQQKAAKYGHTLLGSQRLRPCYNLAMFENSYSLDDRSQFEDRNHREGQTYETLVTDFVASEIDRRAIRALQRKESVAMAVLGFAEERRVLRGVEV